MTSRLSYEDVKKVLRYERSTGKLFWIVDQPYGAKYIKAGQEAGCYCLDGYVRVHIKKSHA